MIDWCTAKDIAGRPDAPATVSGVIRAAAREGWESRPRAGKGGGREYLLATLPERTRLAIQEAYLRAAMADVTALQAGIPRDPAVVDPAQEDPAAVPTPTADRPLSGPLDNGTAQAEILRLEVNDADLARLRHKAENQAKFAALAKDHPKRLRAKARVWLIHAYHQVLREQPDLAKGAARALICDRVNSGELAMPPAVAAHMASYRQQTSLSEATLHRWILRHETDGIWGLTDGYGTRAGHSLIDGQPLLQRLILGQMFAQPQSSGKDLFALLATQAADLAAQGVKLPTLRTIQHYRQHWIEANPSLWMKMVNPGQWKNHFQVAFGSQHEAVTRLNQLWEMDSTPGDWLLKDGRHTVIGCIDLWSRRLTLHVSKSSSAHAVGQCFRRAVLAWGLPEAVRTDNGKDYVSDYFTTVLNDLEVDQPLCIPFASEQKGTIERTLKTMAYGALKLLPGFIGHNVAEAQAIRSRDTFAKRVMTPGEIIAIDLTAADLQAKLNEWVTVIYHQDGHGGLDGQTPFARAASWTGELRTVDERALDALLAPIAGERTVGKKGIQWEKRLYNSPAIVRHIGVNVLCRYDESDLGRLYVYTDDRFIGVAECSEMTGISRAEVAAMAHAEQRKFMAAQTEELRAHKRGTAQNAAELILRHRAIEAGKLAELPRPSTAHRTPALDAAADAVEARDPAPMRRDTPEQQAQKAALTVIEAPLGGGATLLTPTFPESPRARYIKWLRLNNEVIRGDHDGKQELLREWHAYAESAEWRTQKAMAEDFPAYYQWQDAAGGAGD